MLFARDFSLLLLLLYFIYLHRDQFHATGTHIHTHTYIRERPRWLLLLCSCVPHGLSRVGSATSTADVCSRRRWRDGISAQEALHSGVVADCVRARGVRNAAVVPKTDIHLKAINFSSMKKITGNSPITFHTLMHFRL